MCAVLAGAAWTDLSSGKVRNWWLAVGVALGIWCRGAMFFPAAGVVCIPAFLLFRFRMMGAGDGKLMAVIAGYLGIEDGIHAIGAGMAVGAIWSLCRLWHDRSLKARLEYLSDYFIRTFQEQRMIIYDRLSETGSRHRIPLAACLAAGVYLYLFGVWAANAGGGIL